jgi:O-antigen/teichoic acid export membrane protein
VSSPDDSLLTELEQPAVSPRASAATRRQVRGSTLLLAGRMLGMVLNFGMQVLIVRYLATADYGAFAYALSIVSLAESVVTFGLDRAVTRFIPIYDERGHHDKILGTIVLVLGVIGSLGIGVVLLVFGLQAWLADTVIGEPQAISLLVILIILAPLHALDQVLMGLFAVFVSARAIFFRKYVLGPGLRLAVVGVLVLGQLDVHFLAAGYVAAGAIAIVVFTVLLVRILAKRGLLDQFRASGMRVPGREILSFTVPLLTSDLVFVVLHVSDVALLGYFHDTDAVAAFRVIEPLAGFNLLVFSSFTLLFTPAAARFFARGDRAAIADLYWRTAIWMAILTFPIFAATFALAEPVTVTLYEERYRESATYLALLSLAYYFNAAFGFNGLTLKVFGKLRYVVTINVIAALLNLGLNLLLIPPFGPLGAAIGTFTTLIAHNVLKQAGLRLRTGIDPFEWQYLRVYVVIAAASVTLFAVQLLVRPPLFGSVAMVVVASAVVVVTNRRALKVEAMFPELMKVSIARWFFKA